MLGGIVYGGFLPIMIMAAMFFAVVAWLVLNVSSVVTDTGPQARSYPFAGVISIVAGIVSAIGQELIYEWMRGERYPYTEGAMMGSVFAASVMLAIAMKLLGLRLARLRRSKAA